MGNIVQQIPTIPVDMHLYPLAVPVTNVYFFLPYVPPVDGPDLSKHVLKPALINER